jgi:hypothetical protein
MEALGGRGSIAPTHSRPQYLEVSGQRHALARLCPGERTPGTHCTGSWVGLRAGSLRAIIIRCSVDRVVSKTYRCETWWIRVLVDQQGQLTV